MPVDSEALDTRFTEDGYVIVRGAYSDQLRELRRICEGALARFVTTGTEDNQPSGRNYSARARMLIHLNHPDYHREQPADLATLLNAVAGEEAIAIATAILAEPPLFMQCNLYVEPPRESWVGGWHRDCQYDKFDLRPDEDTERIILSEAVPAREVHMHICLCDSAATEIVPGSHNRWDTPEEYEVRVNDYWSDAMPGREPIRLQAGDLAFFHVNSIHRGLYSRRKRRRTIAVTWGTASRPRPATREDMNGLGGYVASYQPWFGRSDLPRGRHPDSARDLRAVHGNVPGLLGPVVRGRPEPRPAPLLRGPACRGLSSGSRSLVFVTAPGGLHRQSTRRGSAAGSPSATAPD